MRGTESWLPSYRVSVIVAVEDVGKALTKIVGGSPSGAFRSIYAITPNKPLVFLWGINGLGKYHLTDKCSGINVGGCTSSSHLVNFYGYQYPKSWILTRNVVHELGHALDNIFIDEMIKYTQEGRPYLYPHRTPSTRVGDGCSWPNLSRDQGGFAGPLHDWQFSTLNTPSEVWADMFVGWVYGKWSTRPEDFEKGLLRRDLMDQFMGNLLTGGYYE